MHSHSLTVVGTGIKFVSHLTTEAKAYIEQADKILYLVNDPALKLWLSELNNSAESLDVIYLKHELRKDAYQAITSHILETLSQFPHLCVVIYGHPCFYAQSALAAVKIAKSRGIYANILPAISSEDCLFADLLIDPGTHGCQSYDATDFLLAKKKVESTAHLILYQIDAVGILDHSQYNESSVGLELLVEYLTQYYPDTHSVIIYEAAQYPSFNHKEIHVNLSELSRAPLSRISTLYIPPVSHAVYDEELITKIIQLT